MTLKELVKQSTILILTSGSLLLLYNRLNLPYDLLREKEEIIITNRQSIDLNSRGSENPKLAMTRLEERIATDALTQDKAPSKYAVLISGQTDSRHLENISLAYTTLIINGFKEENIYSLVSLEESLKKQSINYHIDASPSRAAIKMLFEHMAARISSQDMIFIYMTGHGQRKALQFGSDKPETEVHVSTLNLPGQETISELDFYSLLKKISPKIGILFDDACYGGGQAIRAGSIPNFIGISSCEEARPSTDNTFPQAFFKSWQHNQADNDKNDRISIEEAFNYARKHDKNSKSGFQTPLLISSSNPAKAYLD